MKIVAILAFSLAIALANAQGNYKKVCYFANWAYYRNTTGQYGVDKLDAFECTHLIYGFAVLNNVTYEMTVYDSWVDISLGGYQKFTALKAKNPNLKTLIALGGWNDSAFSTQYSELVADPVKMANFVTKALAFVRQYNFDGLDFDWEYPGDPGKPEDKENFITLLTMLRDAFKPYNLLLTMAPSCSIVRAGVSYNIPALAEVVDFVNFMGYDIHGAWETQTDHHSPLYRRSFDDTVSDQIVAESIDFWLAQGMPAEKLIFGVPSYGRSYTLADVSQTGLLAPAIDAGPPGPYTGLKGFYSFYEICLMEQSGMTVVTDPTGKMGAYGYKGNTWVSWDEIDMLVKKVQYAMDKGLGGIMFWELSLDDFNGYCNLGPRPFSKTITATLEGRPPVTSNPSATTAAPPGSLTCTTEGAYYADPANCNKYYRCVNGKIVAMYCSPGLVFNPSIDQCDWPYNVPGCV
ncbi:acidic mammalian chitinase-like [Daphnia carinata]|uniref:acidic mammalian chitinase-like n=1 Tax=Daphnia carinata TaxID=120202 RepID=UPI002580ED80|nr:acidic mammalian chitinase-like [Daphnia carinata]